MFSPEIRNPAGTACIRAVLACCVACCACRRNNSNRLEAMPPDRADPCEDVRPFILEPKLMPVLATDDEAEGNRIPVLGPDREVAAVPFG